MFIPGGTERYLRHRLSTRPRSSSNTRGSGHRRCVVSQRAASRQRSSSAFKPPAEPPIVPRSSAWACSNVQRRIARRPLLSVAFAPSLAAKVCQAGRSPVSVICVPLRANGEDLLANGAIRSHYGRRDLVGIRQCAASHPQLGKRNRCLSPAGSSNSGSGDQARRRK